MPELIIMRGLPASGKTTKARAWVAEKPEQRVRVNRDDFRAMLRDAQFLSKDGEALVTRMHHEAIRAALKAGLDVVCDDTNLTLRFARALAWLASDCGCGFSVDDSCTNVELDECRRRNSLRERPVPDKVIIDMYQRTLAKGALPIVDIDLPARCDVRERMTRPTALIFDIDGTLATHEQRGHHDYGKVGGDTPVPDVAELTRQFSRLDPEGPVMIIVSGRTDACSKETADWLMENDVEWDELFMRKDGDTRRDSVVKEEIYWNEIRPAYNVIGVFDDRKQVVDMWRRIGLTCYQVAEGDF